MLLRSKGFLKTSTFNQSLYLQAFSAVVGLVQIPYFNPLSKPITNPLGPSWLRTSYA